MTTHYEWRPLRQVDEARNIAMSDIWSYSLKSSLKPYARLGVIFGKCTDLNVTLRVLKQLLRCEARFSGGLQMNLDPVEFFDAIKL